MGNDADLAALAENRFGAGRDVDSLVYITISTGIGGGMIFDDRFSLVVMVWVVKLGIWQLTRTVLFILVATVDAWK